MTPEQARREMMKKHHFSNEQIDWGIRAGFRCEYCGRDLLASVDDYDSWQAEHICPQSKQKVDKGLNMAIACKTCNFMKRAEVFGSLPTSPEERAQIVQLVRRQIATKRAEKQMAVPEIRQLAQVLLDAPAGQ